VGFEKGIGELCDFGIGITDVAVKLVEQDVDGGLGGEDGIPKDGKVVVGG